MKIIASSPVACWWQNRPKPIQICAVLSLQSDSQENGVRVVSATEAIATDSTGILLESLLEGYAEFYSVELEEKSCAE